MSTTPMTALPLTPSSAVAPPTPRTVAGSSDASAAPRAGFDSVMDELMAQYLRRRGYRVTPATSDDADDVDMEDATKTENAASPIAVESAGRPRASSADRRRLLGDDDADSASIEEYAQSLGLNTESCAANHIVRVRVGNAREWRVVYGTFAHSLICGCGEQLFYGMTGGDPSTYEHAYAQLMEWVCNSLDMYKYELHAVAYPLFVHCFLELVAKGYTEHAQAFLHRHAKDHTRLHLEELRLLGMVFTPAHLRASEYAQQVLHSKFNIQMSLLSFELLNAFLSQEQLFVLLAILNERVNLIVTANQPGMQIEELDESLSSGIVTNLEAKESTSGYKTSDQVAQIVASSDMPNESEIGIPLTSGDYNVEYMVRAAGGEGSTLEDLHAIKMNWGLLKPRRLHADPESEAGGAAGSKDDDEGGSNSGANGSGSGGAGGSGGGSGDASGNNSAESDKKGASGGDAGAGSAAAAGSKGGDKSSGKAGDKNAGAGSSADAQRKLKRVKLSTDAADQKKGDLEMMGPVPDRRSAFNADIMEKLVLRQPAEMKIQELEDLRARAPLSKSSLPSALCFTFLNPSVHITNMCFSDDATMVGASCDDSSFRVWRNDDQPLGTAKGSVYHGSVDETDEDEKTAILRGHSSAVYGASFSPDNRFALTGSADSTVRLWSLASKSNLAIYRSHSNYPVWDVQFGPYGYYFASCSMDRTARLWSTDHVTPLRIFAGHLSDVDCVQFHPNHNYLATGSSDKTVRLWDVQTGKCIRIFTGHFNGVKCLAFSRNGRYLASSGDDQYINIWDLQAGKRLETLVGHKGMVTSLDFSQESAILASSGMDATVRLWDMKALTEKAAVLTPVTSTAGVARIPVTTQGGGVGNGASGRASSSLIKPVHIVRSSAMQELPTSRFLLKTLRSKQTPMYRVHYTSRNLLLSGGVFQPKTES